jgi:hypothetical protein
LVIADVHDNCGLPNPWIVIAIIIAAQNERNLGRRLTLMLKLICRLCGRGRWGVVIVMPALCCGCWGAFNVMTAVLAGWW